ncbi:MAG: GNAT family N-acetyltransferase [Pseudomonadota bacterium]
MIPHEAAIAGPAAEFASQLSAQLPEIRTERLCLRAATLNDFPVWADIFCGPAGLFLGGPFTRDEAFTEFCAGTGMWLLRGHGLWTVEDLSGDVLGFVLIGFEPGDQEPELGFLFADAAQGHGYASEAAIAARDHALQTLRMPNLVSYTDPENIRANRLVERLGAVREADLDGAHVWRHAGAQA